MQNKISIAIAGSTSRTTLIAQTLLDHSSFSIPWVLTPVPKKIGRKQIVTTNPLDNFAQKNKIKTIFVEKKLDESIKNQIKNLKKPSLLLVVDFGYLVPSWLLEWPTIAPLNIHPSELPKWRGSSPGQFSLLFGDKKSAVSVIVMNNKLDQGPIIHQEFFSVNPEWTQTEYYEHSFNLINQILPKILLNFSKKKLIPNPQSLTTPTPIARQLKKQDSFIDWHALQKILKENKEQTLDFTQENLDEMNHGAREGALGHAISEEIKTSPVLETILKNTSPHSHPATIHNACRAFSPWPGLWTIIPMQKGDKRMKILSCSLRNNQLKLKKVQMEGKTATKWTEIKNLLS